MEIDHTVASIYIASSSLAVGIIVLFSTPTLVRTIKIRVLRKFVYNIKESKEFLQYIDFFFDVYTRSSSRENYFVCHSAISHHLKACEEEFCLCFLVKNNPEVYGSKQATEYYLSIFEGIAEKNKRYSKCDLSLQVYNDTTFIQRLKERHLNSLATDPSQDQEVQYQPENLLDLDREFSMDASDLQYTLDLRCQNNVYSLLCSFYKNNQARMEGNRKVTQATSSDCCFQWSASICSNAIRP